MLFRYTDSKLFFENIANASLYSAICPPVFLKENLPVEGLKWYYNYLLTLQNEYKELIEFCFDEDFYPEVMEKIKPAERYYLYKIIHNQPLTIQERSILVTAEAIQMEKSCRFIYLMRIFSAEL